MGAPTLPQTIGCTRWLNVCCMMNGVIATRKNLGELNGSLPEEEPPSQSLNHIMTATLWRDSLRRVMAAATRQELNGRHGDIDASFDYRWEHVNAVVTLVLRLGAQTGADLEIVEAAAWLHDVCKWTHGEAHAEAGAVFARDFLPQTDFPPDKIEAVAEAIADHQGLWRDEPLTVLESQILWDADKLSKLGLTSVIQWTGRALAGDKSRTVAELMARSRDPEWQRLQARIAASMHTEPARRAARRRLAAYQLLWDELEMELSGDDLLLE